VILVGRRPRREVVHGNLHREQEDGAMRGHLVVLAGSLLVASIISATSESMRGDGSSTQRREASRRRAERVADPRWLALPGRRT